MASPFPGMDPYLEAHWLDVHPRLVVGASEQIQGQLGEDLIARIEERIVVEDPFGETRIIGPDVRVVEHGRPGEPTRAAGSVAVVEPIRFTVEAEPFAQRFIEIRDLTTDGRVITVIEFLSPSNKLPGDGRNKYLQKQRECREGSVNLVEIDLTRAGVRELLVYRWNGARARQSTYAVSVWRSASPTACDLYAIGLRDRLPTVSIPLRAQDEDVALELQPLIGRVYTQSRYERTTDYRSALEPPLEGEEGMWVEQMLHQAGKR